MNWYKQAQLTQTKERQTSLINNPVNNKNQGVKPKQKQVYSPKPLDTHDKKVWAPVQQTIQQRIPGAAEYLKNPRMQPAFMNMFQNMSPKKSTDPFLGPALNRFNTLYQRQQREEAKEEEAEIDQVGKEQETYGNLAEENEQGTNKKANISIYEHKEAHLVNKKTDTEDNDIYLTCQYCGRWATNPDKENTTKDERIWKKPETLDAEETTNRVKAMSQMSQQDFANITKAISHGVCPICFKLLEKYGFDTPAKKVKELSLTYE